MPLSGLIVFLLEAISLIHGAFAYMFGSVIATALFFIAGIYLFAIFYQIFFERLARKEIFQLEMPSLNLEYSYADVSFGQIFRFLAKSLVLFPLLATLITISTTIFLIFMSKSQPVQSIASISIAIVMAIRLLAYTNEKLASDLAKVLPFSLLTVILTDPATFSIGGLSARAGELAGAVGSLIPLFFAFIGLEIAVQLFLQFQKLTIPAPAPQEPQVPATSKKKKGKPEEEDDFQGQ